MKRNRRFLSLLLAICLIVSLIPAVLAAEEATLAESVLNDQIVNFADEEWIVIDNNVDSIILLLKTPKEPVAYNASGLSNSWAESDAKKWCAAFEEGLDETALSAVLGEAGDKVFFLSHEELVTYWVNNSAGNLRTDSGWWLRYDDDNVGGDLFGIAVSDAGFVGFPHVATNYGARPAIKLDPSKVAAMVKPDGKDVWDLMVIDENFSADFVPSVSVDETVVVNYSGAVANSTVYALIIDQLGQTVAYASGSATENSISIALPENVGRYTVRVFNEVEGVTSKVVDHEFSIADNLGNVIEWNLNISDDISANFNIALNETLNKDDTKIRVTSNGVTREYFASELEDVLASDDDTACVRLTVNMLAPQMTNVITIQVISGDSEGGNQYFTIRQYGDAIVNGDFSSTTKNLVKHMLNYGAKAQTYFNYNTDNLANANTGVPAQENVPAPDANTAAKVTGAVDGIVASGASLVLNSKTTLRFYFKLADGKKIEDFDFGGLTTYEKANGDETLYFVDMDGIAPYQLDEDRTVTVTGASGELTVTYSPVAYIRRFAHRDAVPNNLVNLLVAMYNYNLAADAYVSAK